MLFRRLGRQQGHRRALLRSGVTALLEHERITTTEIRAKELRSAAERIITIAKKGDLSARRQVAAYVTDPDVVKKVFDSIAPRYAGRPGGYTRILKTEVRRGDAAPMAILELV